MYRNTTKKKATPLEKTTKRKRGEDEVGPFKRSKKKKNKKFIVVLDSESNDISTNDKIFRVIK